MSEIKFRASGVHHIMTSPRSKSETISEGTKTHLIDTFVTNKYGRQTEIHTRFTNKGIQIEEDSLTLYSRAKKTFFMKNADWLCNDFICGTPDIITETSVIDIKSSYDIYSFFRSKYKPLNTDYYWQIQSYLALTGLSFGVLAYCLVDTPDSIIEQEKKSLWYSMGGENGNQTEFEDACKKIERLHKYADMPINERYFEIEIPRDEEAIKSIYERVKECRKYMKEKFNYPSELCLAN